MDECRWRDRPLCTRRGLPVPFVAAVDPATGEGDFRHLDPELTARLVKFRLCAVCGDPVIAWHVFLGDPAALDPGGYFMEPPMHEQGALLALGLIDQATRCPFMAQAKVPRRPLETGDTLVAPMYAGPRRPQVMAYTRHYRPGKMPVIGGAPGQVQTVFYPGTVARVRTFGFDERGWAVEEVAAGAQDVL